MICPKRDYNTLVTQLVSCCPIDFLVISYILVGTAALHLRELKFNYHQRDEF